jgi:PncC family amidohydrolase
LSEIEFPRNYRKTFRRRGFAGSPPVKMNKLAHIPNSGQYNSDMNDEPREVQAGELLIARGFKLAVAESCTGGLIAHRITNVPGSSTYFMGGITAYTYEAKARLLGVEWETLQTFGAVSRETVLEMARGVRQVLAADVGLSVSGIAGPGGGTPEKPVGLVWIGLSMPWVEDAWEFIWKGDRLKNKELSAEKALEILIDYLRQTPPLKAD